MKKTIKIFSIILIAIMLVMSIAPIVNASAAAQNIASQLKDPAENVTGSAEILELAKTGIGIINIVAVVVAVIILLVLGIKYMMGSASEKAEYKKSMIPYLVGAFIIFAAPTLVNILVGIFSNFNGGSGETLQ